MVERCDRCGKRLKVGKRRLRMDRRIEPNGKETRWVTDEFIRYYCPSCALEVRKAIRRCEMEVDGDD